MSLPLPPDIFNHEYDDTERVEHENEEDVEVGLALVLVPVPLVRYRQV